MNILVPLDLQFEAQKVKQLQGEVLKQFTDEIEKCVPTGFTLEVSADSSIYVYVSLKDDESIYRWTDRIMYKFKNSQLTLSENITADQVYRCNGLMQLIVTADISKLGPLKVVK